MDILIPICEWFIISVLLVNKGIADFYLGSKSKKKKKTDMDREEKGKKKGIVDFFTLPFLKLCLDVV